MSQVSISEGFVALTVDLRIRNSLTPTHSRCKERKQWGVCSCARIVNPGTGQKQVADNKDSRKRSICRIDWVRGTLYVQLLVGSLSR